MPREYYDRGLPAKRRHPANVEQQAAYDLLRTRLLTALNQDWQAICDASPAVAEAKNALDVYVETKSTRSFTIFRPEDMQARHEAGSPVFLR